jgi:ABC-type sugar transport system substrate-binding protein
MVGANEQAAAGLLAGVEASGRESDCIVIANDFAFLGIENLYKDPATVWIGSANYFPEDYGQPLVDMVKGLVAGEEIPMAWYVETIWMNRDNIGDYYENPNA